VASACVVPENYRKEIDSKCFKFIWNNIPDKVKRNTVVGKLEYGGLKIIDIQSYCMSLTASWVSYPIIKQQSFVIKLDKFAYPYNLFSDVCKM
jgi:hypothetical protein